MSLRDLTARSSQAKSKVSDEAMKTGKDIYRKIVDDGDAEELRKFQRLATASANMERPVEIKRRSSRVDPMRHIATALMTIFER